MTKRAGFLAVMSLLAVACGGTGSEPDEVSGQEPGTVSAQACLTLYNQGTPPTCRTRDDFKMNTASFCPQGYYGAGVTVHDPCATAGSYLYADILCCK